MTEHERRRPMIIESWEGDDPLDAFALEGPNTSNQPASSVVARADDREAVIDFNEVPSVRPRRWAAAAVTGVAALAVVAAATVGLLSTFVGGSRSPENVTTIASQSNADAPLQVGSAGQLAEQDAVPEAIDREPIRTTPLPSADPQISTTPAPRAPAPVSVPAAVTTGRPAVVTTTPSPNAARSASRTAPVAAPSNANAARPGAAAAATPRGVTTTPLSTVTAAAGANSAPPPSVATATPASVAPAPPANVAPAPALSVAPAPPPSVAPAPTPAVVTAAASSAIPSASAVNNVAAAPPRTLAAAAPGSATAQSAVTAVLQRYAAAFSALDVRGAKAVWPQVNQDALTRAFSALQEQQFDLGNCDIWITGASAVASCAGRATYTPKVGNRKQRSEAREWTFYLDQDDQRWSIATVKTR